MLVYPCSFIQNLMTIRNDSQTFHLSLLGISLIGWTWTLVPAMALTLSGRCARRVFSTTYTGYYIRRRIGVVTRSF